VSTQREAQRKVTAFVTRGVGESAQLLVFWHTGGGIQVPAGTVEQGESFERAACREAAEETGLPDLRLAAHLGTRTHELPAGHAVFIREVLLRTRPGPDAPVTTWSPGRAGVRVLETSQGYARVLYVEQDQDVVNGLVYARLEGWVPQDCLRHRQERAYFHFRTSGSTPQRWRHEDEGRLLTLYWVPLAPKPAILTAIQQPWLDEHYDVLLRYVDQPAARDTPQP
jgi:8-oxo-dGTP pyrophosphatase MutT (NUDIX family)